MVRWQEGCTDSDERARSYSLLVNACDEEVRLMSEDGKFDAPW